MKVGTILVNLIGGPPTPTYPFGRWISDLEKLLTAQERAGFTYVGFTHAYQSTGMHGMQPMVLMSRVAAFSGGLRLGTDILQLPVYNAMDAAYNIATLDHITHGRLDVGIGIGYNPYEIGPAGVDRKDRVPRFEESVEVMRKFWTGDPVHYEGRFITVAGTRLQLLPIQKPHPPLWGAAYSNKAAARAGRLLDGVIIGPFQRFEDMGVQLDAFRDEWSRHHSEEPTRVAAWRTTMVGKDPKEAMETIRASRRLTFGRNIQGGMQEDSTANLTLDIDQGDGTDWAILGNYQDCLEGARRCRDEFGITHLNLNFYNLPEDIDARCDYIEGFGDEVIRKL